MSEVLPISSLCLFSLLYQAAIGLAITLGFADTGGGWERDHPPAGRRIAGIVPPVVAVVAILVPVLFAVRADRVSQLPVWLVCMMGVLVPFIALSIVWSITWRTGQPALVRRRWGNGAVQAALVGLIGSSALLLFLYDQPLWQSKLVLALQFGTTGTLGSLLALAIFASPGAGERSEIAANVPRSILAPSMLLMLLALIDVLISWKSGDQPAGAGILVLLWSVGGLLVPAVGAFVALPKWPARPWAWPALLAVAVIGLWAANLLMFGYEGGPAPEPWQTTEY